MYIHHMIDMDGKESLKAKQNIECVAASHNVTIKHYHGDNGLLTQLYS